MKRKHYENWLNRVYIIFDIFDNIIEGRVKLNKDIIEQSLKEANKLIKFSSEILKKYTKLTKEDKKNISKLIIELKVIRKELNKWLIKFNNEKYRIKKVKIKTKNKNCLVCGKKLNSGYGYVYVIEFYFRDLDIWVIEYITEPAGPTCIDKINDNINFFEGM